MVAVRAPVPHPTSPQRAPASTASQGRNNSATFRLQRPTYRSYGSPAVHDSRGLASATASPSLADIHMSDDRRPHRAVRYGSPDGAVIDICRDVGRAEDSGFMNRE